MARKHKIQRALTHLVQAIIRFAQTLTSRNTYRFLRTAFVTSRRRLQAGFVLPTTTLLIIVMILVVSTLMFRSYQRSTDAISEFQRQEVQNAAAPAIERAKAKLEQLFSSNLVAGIPPEALLEETLLSNDYVFPNETQLTMTAEGQNVPAWSFQVNDVTVAYTILLRTSRGGVTMDPDSDGSLTSDEEKANALLVRNGPLISGRTDNPLCQGAGNGGDGQVLGEGWFSTGPTSSLQKNFQVYAVAIPTGASNQSISTLQYQQDRYIDRGNKWGAWFRTDIELFPGPRFVWNGAMHTQGSFFVRAQNSFDSFLISSKDSCFYNPSLNSDITTAQHLVYSIPSLPSANGQFSGAVNFDLHEAGAAPTAPTSINLNNENLDSVTGSLNNTINIALDPVKILTSDSTPPLNRSAAGWAPDDNWEGSELTKRITINNPACPPYVDDTYRADNRYGPKTAYTQAVRDPENPENCTIPVGQDAFNYGQIINNDRLIRNTPPVDQPTEYGLDGYWERRSRAEGLRVIVGQRLELGNPFGWVQDRDRDGAYNSPIDKVVGDDPLNPNSNFPSHEQRQRRTLRDNLAAVQSTAVYFHSQLTGDLPVAFVATTVHPGSQKTLKESATFDRISFEKRAGAAFAGLNTAQGIIATDFFNGRGTNGMEFEGLTGGFQNNAGRQIALRNLANFAGEVDGAFPPLQEAGRVHPSPQLTMWGDYSNLRRILDNPTSYDSLSLADQSTLQTASGTLGMLAYNINYLQAYHYENNTNRTRGLEGSNGRGLNDLAFELWQLQNGINTPATGDYEVSSTTTPATAYNLPPEAYIAKLEEKRNALAAGAARQRMDYIVKLARLVMTKEQVERDRTNGFAVSVANHPANATPISLAVGTAPAANVNIACNVSPPATGGNNYFGLGAVPNAAQNVGTAPNVITQQQYVVGLSRLCSNEPKFPSLYYLFPTENHDHDGSGTVTDPAQPPTEPYIQAVNAVNYQSLTEEQIGQMALQPRVVAANWILPSAGPINPTGNLLQAAPNASDRELIRIVNGANQEFRQVAFKDSALYNGREAMNVRVLNIDLNMLRTTSAPGGDENWLPETGIVYAFREDAVREDAIARPPGAQMNANGAGPTDPTLVALPAPATGAISTKSVDYYPDPDRRPYGFRLKNGSTVRRQGNPDNPAGMTFVSDNPVYIQGHFNLHNSAAIGTGNTIQEFTQLLGGTPTRNQFYGRTANQLNPQFANPAQDWWRPTEIMADAVTILSNNFCDGSIEDGIIYAGVSNPNVAGQLLGADRQRKYGCNTGTNYTSYINQNRPFTNAFHGPWMSENRFDPPTQQNAAITTANPVNSANSPIMIAPSGDPVHCTVTGTACTASASWQTYRLDDNRTYLRFTDGPGAGKRHMNAADTTVNMVMVSGVIPQQLNQINGGFHNFPRLLENWNQPAQNLFIQGSLIQLNFSNYATGPFTPNAWEPTQSPTGNHFNYYQPPNRNWGYDVGLQYAPAGPISSRMIVPNSKRDEFYREPNADDPYICKLRDTLNAPCN